MNPAEEIAIDQAVALECVRRVAESLPGFTFQEIGGRMSGTAPMLETSTPPLIALPASPGED